MTEAMWQEGLRPVGGTERPVVHNGERREVSQTGKGGPKLGKILFLL